MKHRIVLPYSILLVTNLLLNNEHAVRGLQTSPWAPAVWRFAINVGREVDTDMPESWGDSGARLAFSMDVIVQPDKDEKEPEWRCLTIPEGDMGSFISAKGQQVVRIKKGGWNMELPPDGGSKKGIATKLNLWLDLENDIERNDVTLSAGRLYLSANCWREEEWEQGLKNIYPFVDAAEYAQKAVETALNHETGDRRLDGTDAIETAKAYKDMAELVRYRDEMKRLLKDKERVMPSPRTSQNVKFGYWPGSVEPFAVLPTDLNTKLEKKQFLFFSSNEYPVIGTWKGIPLDVPED